MSRAKRKKASSLLSQETDCHVYILIKFMGICCVITLTSCRKNFCFMLSNHSVKKNSIKINWQLWISLFNEGGHKRSFHSFKVCFWLNFLICLSKKICLSFCIKMIKSSRNFLILFERKWVEVWWKLLCWNGRICWDF